MRLFTLLPISSALISMAFAAPLLGEKVDAPGCVAPDEFVELDVSAEEAKISQEIPNYLDARWGGESPSDRTANVGPCVIT
ncbi:hypothetical protein DFH08DRAFT_977780 [Mycena albidolilacea]|uniref:Pheromone n=1 Tax=Mycena albidolilacea TaxID=1033008 RepID=A0AAD6Z0B9_9AGAR|nr:hypothetical protein DFH08DRAFT_977780 [Mycena albidolilacea]